jgi:hypothetical protein
MSEQREFTVRPEPFPHVVVDDFTDPELLREVVRQWPADGWRTKACRTSIKSSCADMALMPTAARTVIDALHTPAFMNALGDAFGLRLSPDPQYHAGHLEGGGLHMIPRGGHLGMHVDFNRHPKAEWVRVANLLLYLNEDWDDEWGGHLRLEWPDRRVADRIAPRFNRMVAFATSERSWHGHPEPLACPEGQSRKSIAVYYYSRTAQAGAGHGTIYR